MKKDNKKALYESIMASVAKEVKKALNEKWNDSTDEFEYEIDKIYEYFDNICRNFEITRNERLGTIAVYFPDRQTMLYYRENIYGDRNDVDLKSLSDDEWRKFMLKINTRSIPHITISKPPRLNGGFGINVYKGGNYDKNEYPNPRKAFKENGNPKYETLEELFVFLDEHIFNGDWAERLNIELK